MRIAKIIVSMGVTLSIMVVIFMFSAQDGGQSGSLSTAVAHMLATVFVPGFDAMGLSEQAALIDQLAWRSRSSSRAGSSMPGAVTATRVHIDLRRALRERDSLPLRLPCSMPQATRFTSSSSTDARGKSPTYSSTHLVRQSDASCAV